VKAWHGTSNVRGEFPLAYWRLITFKWIRDKTGKYVY